MTAGEEAKAQQALAAWDREQAYSKLRMHRVRHVPRAAKKIAAIVDR